MKNILVSGLINIENNIKINSFPVEYNPVNYLFFGTKSLVSGVGFNISKALTTLDNNVNFVSLLGNDIMGEIIIEKVKSFKINTKYIYKNLKETPQSIILYDNDGNRSIYVDLKDIQETKYLKEEYENALNNMDLAVLCNVNFSRDFLELTKNKKIPIATDVHALSDVKDKYNTDFMKYSDILFLSHENLNEKPDVIIKQISKLYNNEIIVIGLGKNGAIMKIRNYSDIFHFPAVKTRPIINTIGAGDALFSSFINFYLKTSDPYLSLKKASYFASYKIGEKGASDGFVSEKKLNEIIKLSLY